MAEETVIQIMETDAEMADLLEVRLERATRTAKDKITSTVEIRREQILEIVTVLSVETQMAASTEITDNRVDLTVDRVASIEMELVAASIAAIGGRSISRYKDKENVIICEDAEVKVTHGAYYNGIGGSDEANVNTDCLFTTGSIDGVHGTVTAHDYGDWTQCDDGTEHRSCARCGLEQVRGQQDVKPGGEDKDGGQSAKAARPATDEDAFLTLYTVTDMDGRDIEFTAAEDSGALTITVDDSAAVLSVYMPKLLMQYGVQSMTLVTDKQETTIVLADYEDYAPPIVLTHDGAARTLTAGGEALDLN